jgi:hypothetical protein
MKAVTDAPEPWEIAGQALHSRMQDPAQPPLWLDTSGGCRFAALHALRALEAAGYRVVQADDPELDDRRTCNRWRIATTVALTVVTALALACLARHL